MKSLITWFIKYPIWSNVLLLGLFFFGYHSLNQLRSSFFPESEGRRIQITIVWPGAAAEEVEEGAVQVIEENLRGIVGVDQVTSVSRENSGAITVEVTDGFDPKDVLTDVKNAVDRVANYPAAAEKPVVYLAKARSRALTIALYGDLDLWTLKERARQFRDALLQLDGITQVSVAGLPNREIVIETRQIDLLRYGMQISEIVSAVQSSNLDLSGGNLTTANEDIVIRAYNKEYHVEELRRIVLRSQSTGAMVRLEQIADIREQWEDSPNRLYYNGKRAVQVVVDKTLDEDLLEVAKNVKGYIPIFEGQNPAVKVAITEDPTISLQQRIDLLVSNGLQGFVLVVLSLAFFLNLRVSFWVAMGIPTSLAGMLVMGNLVGITINMISLFGMIIVLGMLVDDAVVTAEKIYQDVENGVSPLKAAIYGTSSVAAPIFSSVMTTILAFLPFFFFAGDLGSFIWQLAFVVIASLSFSFVESMFILPAHLVWGKSLHKHSEDTGIRKKLNAIQDYLVNGLYAPVLRFSMKHSWVMLAMPVAFYMITIGMLQGGFIQRADFPQIDRDEATLNLALVPGTADHVTDSLLASIEANIWAVNAELKSKRKDGKDVILSLTRSVGSGEQGESGSHVGSINIQMLPAEERDMKGFLITNKIRSSLGAMPGVEKLSFSSGWWGKPVSVSLLSSDLEQLERAKLLLKERLRSFPQLKDVVDNDVKGLREVRLKLRPEAYALGLNPRSLATQVRQSVFGAEIQRLQRGEDEIRLWTRLVPEDRSQLGDLENLRIATPTGQTVPLAQIAEWTMERGRVAINHLDAKREVRIEAEMEDQDASPVAIMTMIRNEVVPEVLGQVKNVQAYYGGQERQNQLFFKSLGKAFPPALVAIIVLLILMHRSYIQAGMIIMMIPLGVFGAMWGHWFHGIMMGRMSMFGAVALAGTVINASIVFIDAINELLKEGKPLRDAVYQAGLSRFRPILLTTATTVLGLAPLIFEPSMQAQFLKPMAVTLAYGLFIGGAFILVMVPAMFLVVNQTRQWVQHILQFFNGKDKPITPENVEPAFRELDGLKEVE